jgi:hypothetical protein
LKIPAIDKDGRLFEATVSDSRGTPTTTWLAVPVCR